MLKRIVNAKADSDGDITAVLFEGNRSFTPLETAIRIAGRGEIENAHVAHTGKGRPYLRTNPDGEEGNNLDSMAGDN